MRLLTLTGLKMGTLLPQPLDDHSGVVLTGHCLFGFSGDSPRTFLGPEFICCNVMPAYNLESHWIPKCIRPFLSLHRRWKRGQIKQKSALLALPLEIILIVEDLLNDVETAAFRTTCRQPFHHEPRLQSTWAGASRVALLRLIEQDNSKLHYCRSCNVLHPLNRI
jgi:hypothetical protein